MLLNKELHSLLKGAAAVMLASGLALTATSAQALLIDGFGDDVLEIEDGTVDGIAVSTGFHAITDTSLTNALREISVNKTGGTQANHISASVNSGAYNHSQDAGSIPVTGTSSIKWTFDAVDLSAETALQLQVLFSDFLGAISLTLFDGISDATANAVIPATMTTKGIQFKLSDYAGIDLTTVNMALLIIDGTDTPAWDVTVDFFSTPVNEPAMLGLFGLGLVGLGFTARRRRSA